MTESHTVSCSRCGARTTLTHTGTRITLTDPNGRPHPCTPGSVKLRAGRDTIMESPGAVGAAPGAAPRVSGVRDIAYPTPHPTNQHGMPRKGTP